MRIDFPVIALTLAPLVGCSADGDRIQRGTPIAHVQLDYGRPDFISDSSGDQTRFYTPSNRPESEWPADAPRTFYYLDRDLFVTFVLGKAVRQGTIDPAVRESLVRTLDRLKPTGYPAVPQDR